MAAGRGRQQSFPVEDQLGRLRGMCQSQQRALAAVASQLERMQAGLQGAEGRRRTLEAEREELLRRTSDDCLRLERLTLPHLTDLDLDLMLSLPSGHGAVAGLIAACERWHGAQDEGIRTGLQELKQAREEAERARALLGGMRRLEAAREEQGLALQRAERAMAEMARARECRDGMGTDIVMYTTAGAKGFVFLRHCSGGVLGL
ncbi:unnamed protein product [Prorocentrum cordatum]|uniref:Uncharacterized protein n=1 Tax=Prorocentrum cordatum TaxID=2364126 RepID=A0ABN9RZ44_9DINO|nr:unnamed protein product [Polarella glacialis]